MSLYSSREPFNDDPYPYPNKYDGSRWIDPGVDTKGYTVVFDPRPEYNRPQNNPTNRLLLAARRAKSAGYLVDFCEGFLAERNTEHAEIDHAQRVLNRLAAFKKEES